MVTTAMMAQPANVRPIIVSLAILWLVVVAVTLRALIVSGIGEALPTFLQDIRHPWRAQFYLDLEAHLLMASSWIVASQRRWSTGLACAAAAVCLGALFTIPYAGYALVEGRLGLRKSE